MKKIISYLLCTVLLYSAKAQQLQLTSQFQLHNFMYNAGAAGMSDHSLAGFSYRSQWSGISGSPRTAMAFASGRLSKMKIGWGGYLYSDKTGPTSRTGLQSAFAYQVQVSKKGKIGFGLEMRLLQFAIDKAKLFESLANDPVLAGASNRMKFDVGAGVYYNDDKLSLGIAVSQLAQSQIGLASVNNATEIAKLYRHYYAIGSYQWQADENTMIIPNAMMVYLPNAPTEFTFGAKVIHQEQFWWGLNMNFKQSWSLQAGYVYKKKFSIGYAYDIYRTPLSQYYTGGGAHELLLRYQFLK